MTVTRSVRGAASPRPDGRALLDSLDLARSLSKVEYEHDFPPLRDALTQLQRRLYESGTPAIVVLEGWDASGKGDTIQRVVERLDPRGYAVYPTYASTEQERQYPFLRRFWLRLPARGQLVLFDRSWYRRVLAERVAGEVGPAACRVAYEAINAFERTLIEDGHILVKIWLEISRKEQRRRFKAIDREERDAWRLLAGDWDQHKRYREYSMAVAEMLERTHTTPAPWTLVEATDRRWRTVRVFSALVEAFGHRFAVDAKGISGASVAIRSTPGHATRSALDRVDLAKSLDRPTYETRLKRLQRRLRELQFAAFAEGQPVVVLYEGWDAAGKGGNIRRLTAMLDPRGYAVVPVAAPHGEDAAHHYLWRFWRRLPSAGLLTVFDRSWYGRVLVERVEGLCAEADWRRAYAEILEFERALVDFGTVLVKFWLHVSPAEQLRRFKEREANPYKRHKITPDDWRNRERWPDYQRAVAEMLARTSPDDIPWTVIAAEDKLWARIRALETLIAGVEKGLRRRRTGKGRRRHPI